MLVMMVKNGGRGGEVGEGGNKGWVGAVGGDKFVTARDGELTAVTKGEGWGRSGGLGGADGRQHVARERDLKLWGVGWVVEGGGGAVVVVNVVVLEGVEGHLRAVRSER